METDRQAHELQEQLLTHIGDHLIAHVIHQVILPVAEDSLQHGHTQNRHRQHHQQILIFADKDAVQHRPDHPGVRPRQASHEGGTDEGSGQSQPILPQIAKEPEKQRHAWHSKGLAPFDELRAGPPRA